MEPKKSPMGQQRSVLFFGGSPISAVGLGNIWKFPARPTKRRSVHPHLPCYRTLIGIALSELTIGRVCHR